MLIKTRDDLPGVSGQRVAASVGLLAGAALLLLPALAAAQDPPYKPGFPLDIAGQPLHQASPIGSQVLAADLGLTPGYKSIIFGLPSGKLYVVRRNSNGTWGVASGAGFNWPQTLPSHIYSSPAVGDLDGDDEPDIVVGYGSVSAQSTTNGGLKAFRRNGTLMWTVTTADVTPGPANGLTDPVVSTPAIGDVDGDGTMEVVFGGLDHRLYVVNGENGQSNNGSIWPKDMEDTVFSSPALHDMDGDGKLDIIVGSDRYLIDGGRLWVLRYDGTNLPGFPKNFDQVISSSPAVGDIDGDGKPEIVHGTGTFYTDANNDTHGTKPAPLHRVYAWKCDGTAAAGWPVTTQGQVFTSPALANLDGDAALEVVVTTDVSSGSRRVYAFNGNGSQIFATLVKDFFGQSLSASEPLVADVLGTSAVDILVPTNGEVAVFTSAGVQLTENDNNPDDPAKPNFRTSDSVTGATVTDLETDGSDGKIEVIVVSGRDFPNQTITVVHVWNPVDRTSSPPWGSFRGPSEQRLGVAPGTGACLGACQNDTSPLDFFTLTPCRLVDTRNPVGPLGGPSLSSGAVRNFTLTGSCGVPPTAKAVSLNITVTGATGAGFVRFSPNCQPPSGSTINFGPGQTRANNAILPLGNGGILTANALVSPSGSVNLILDVNGYFE